jgi:hypothetical protein
MPATRLYVSRTGANKNMPEKISQQLEAIKGKITPPVVQEVAPPVANGHPLVHLAGSFKGEEWDALLEAIRCNRQALDTQEADIE